MITHTDAESFDGLLIESSIDAIVGVDNNHEIVVWNRTAAALFERSSSNAEGKRLEQVLPSIQVDSDLLAALNEARNGRKSFLPATNQFIHRKHVETHILPLVSDGGTVGMMLLIHDVSHRIVKEEELQQLNNELQKRLRQLKLSGRELSHLTYVTTHNVREPIRTIYTTIERLIQTEANMLSNNGRAAFRRMQSSLNRINLLLDDIVTLTQINIAEQPKTLVDMFEIVLDVLKSLENKIRESGATVKLGELCKVRAHGNQLSLMLHQLILNAIKGSRDALPAVHIECKKVLLDGSNAPEEYIGEYFLLTVAHNGYHYDIEPENIFNIVGRTHDQKKNSEEVVAIAVKVMEAHDGALVIERTAVDNTVVKCFFPV